MTETILTTKNHTFFGGIIDPDDFSTVLPNKKRITNQKQADILPIKIKQKLKNKHMEENYKNMTLEELREMKIVSNTDGRPLYSLTDEKWQREFEVRKMFITPYPKSYKKLRGKYSKESGLWNDETQGEYHGATIWQEYCAFINDALDSLRHGQMYYCYYIYQILDIAKFHYTDLHTKYCDGYWEIWLER